MHASVVNIALSVLKLPGLPAHNLTIAPYVYSFDNYVAEGRVDSGQPLFNSPPILYIGLLCSARHVRHYRIPEPFYDYDKKDKAEVDARWALEMAARAAAEAEKKASKQAAVMQAKADEAAVQAAQSAKRAANKAEKTEKAAGHKTTTKQEAASASPTRLWAHVPPCISARRSH